MSDPASKYFRFHGNACDACVTPLCTHTSHPSVVCLWLPTAAADHTNIALKFRIQLVSAFACMCHVCRWSLLPLPCARSSLSSLAWEQVGSSRLRWYRYDILFCPDSLASGSVDGVRAHMHALMGCTGHIQHVTGKPSRRVQVADISKTRQDPLARAVRNSLRKRGIRKVQCVFSPENPSRRSICEIPPSQQQKYKRSYYGTMSYMPAVLGMHAAAHVLRKLAAQPVGDMVKPAVSTQLQTPEISDMTRPELEGYLYVI